MTDEQIERAVLGAVLTDSKAFARVAVIVRPTDFKNAPRRAIFEACSELFAQGSPIDLLTVKHRLGKRASVTELLDCQAVVNSAANLDYHAKILVQHAMRSEIPEIMAHTASLSEEDPAEAAFYAIDRLTSQIARMRHQNVSFPIDDTLAYTKQMVERKENREKGLTSGLATGIPIVDGRTGGFYPGDMIVGAGRPGMGKTAFLLQLAYNIANTGTPVGILSLEMTKAGLVERLMSIPTGVEYSRLKQGLYSDTELDIVSSASRMVAKLPIFIDDEGGYNTMVLRAKCKTLVEQRAVKVIMIDYLQLITGDPNEYTRVSEASSAIKSLAKELDIPIFALSQLSRALETRGDKRPMLSDLRSSGQIEQDADGVWFFWRPEHYKIEEWEGRSTKNLMYVIQEKWRAGGAGFDYELPCDIATNRIGYRDEQPRLFSEPRTDETFPF
jgi:replicative DNA helicase